MDKPAGLTSHDVVARVRRLAGTRKVGHAGTLDPMATGVLVLGVERATRLLTYLVGADKTYTATIRLGVQTVTDDAEGEVTSPSGADGVRRDAVEAGVAGLTGAIEQVPSAVSAIKVDGRRSYARVRAGEEVELAARPVTVHRFEVLDRRSGRDHELAVLDLDVEVDCSSGTYVRALARDLGATPGSRRPPDRAAPHPGGAVRRSRSPAPSPSSRRGSRCFRWPTPRVRCSRHGSWTRTSPVVWHTVNAWRRPGTAVRLRRSPRTAPS